MRPYARYPTGFPVGFFLLFIFFGWVGPKGTSTTSGCVRQYAPIISHNNV